MRGMLGFFSVFIPMVANAASVSAVVDYIIDGDTFAGRVMLAPDIEITVRVRLLNIDAPEIHGACDDEIKLANRAKERLAELIPLNTKITLTDIQDDKYLGRIDAVVFNAAAQNVEQVLVSEGLARPYDGGRRQSWCK